MSTWDNPATDAELDQFYGVPPTSWEICDANRRAAQGYDKDDLADACYESEQEILQAIGDGNAQALLDIFHAHQVATIKRIAHRTLYGKELDVDSIRKAGL